MVDNQGRAIRVLPYPLKEPLTHDSQPVEGEIVHFTPDMFPSDPDERVTIGLHLSLNEYVTLASAIDIGRDIGYGENSFEVWHLWSKALRTVSIMSCDDFIDCLETSPDVRQSFFTFVTQAGFSNPNRAFPTGTTVLDRNAPGALDEDVKSLSTCNLDALWGGIRHGIVQRMDDNARTVLENLAAINDVPERLQTLLDTIPVIGDLAEFFATNLTQVIPDLLNLYEAHSSEENLDEIACALFAIVCDECRYPTYTEIYDYYKSLGLASGTDIAEMTLQIMTDFVTGSALTAAQVAYFTIQTWQLWTWYIQATFNGKSGTRTLIDYATLGEDFGSNNWFQLCDTCNEPYRVWVWDFTTQGQGGWYADTTDGSSPADDGQFVSGKGWMAGVFGTGQRAELAHSFNPSWRIRAWGVKSNTESGANARNFQLRPTAGTLTGAVNSNANNGSGEYQACRDGLLSLTGYNEIALAWQYTAQTPTRYIEKVAIVFDAEYAPPDAVPTNDPTLCS